MLLGDHYHQRRWSAGAARLACVARPVGVCDGSNMADLTASENGNAYSTRTFLATTLHEVPAVTKDKLAESANRLAMYCS